MKNLEAALKKHKFSSDERTMLFRLKRGRESYERNIKNINEGRTDFWQVGEENLHPGLGQTIVLLMDHPDDKDVVLVYAAVLKEYESNRAGEKILFVDVPFKEIAQTPLKGIKKYIGGKQLTTGSKPTYPFPKKERDTKTASKSVRTVPGERDLTEKDASDIKFLQAAQTKTMRRKHNEMTESLRVLLPDVKQGVGKNAMYDALIKNYDGKHRDLLVEVKSSTEVPHIRMAVGQLYSYWHAAFGDKEPHLAILLPKRPDAEMVHFLRWREIGLLWLSDGKLYSIDSRLNRIAKCVE